MARFFLLCIAGLAGNQGETWGNVHTVSYRHPNNRSNSPLAVRHLPLGAFGLHLRQLVKGAGVDSLPGESKGECKGDRKPKRISQAFVKTISEQIVFAEYMPEESSKKVYWFLSRES